MKFQWKKWFNRFLGLFPSALPQGSGEFDNWADSLIENYELPTQDVDSIKFTLASIVLHLGPQSAYKSKHFFVITLKAAAAKQVAGSVFYDIKIKQQAAQQAAQKAQSEVTGLKAVSSDGSAQSGV